GAWRESFITTARVDYW
nr:immunoglobulin heavy chain junction region [Mus musculus]